MIVKSVLACAGCLVFGEKRECATCNNNVNKINKEEKKMLKINVVDLYVEECNCGTQVRHNNGGNYHAIHKLHLIEDKNNVYCVVLEKTTTREEFTGDQHEVLVFKDGKFHIESDEHMAEMHQVRFRQGEGKIVYQNPSTFIASRKARAEELANTARAFGHEASWEEFLMDI